MRNFFQGFKYAFKGIQVSFYDQRNLKVQAIIALFTIGAGFYFNLTTIEWCVVLIAIGLVICLEMLNSALENVVDLVTREHHPLAGKAKDIAAGAVLFAAIIAVIIGVAIFYKYILPG